MTKKINMKDNTGASSILVIIMMVVLLVFGLAVLTTSLSNLRLGESKKNWLSEYYALEGLVQEAIADYDGVLLTSEEEARASIEDGSYADGYAMLGPLSPDDEQQLFAIVYGDLMAEKLADAIAGNDDAALYLREADPFDVLDGLDGTSGRLEFTVALPDSNYDKHVQVTLLIHGADPDNITEEGTIAERFTIVRHTQEQEAYELDESIEFEDPFEEDGLEGNPFGE